MEWKYDVNMRDPYIFNRMTLFFPAAFLFFFAPFQFLPWSLDKSAQKEICLREKVVKRWILQKKMAESW